MITSPEIQQRLPLNPEHGTRNCILISLKKIYIYIYMSPPEISGRSALNHSTNGVMVDSPSKKQTCPCDLLHSHAKWFIMNLLFYDQNESV